MMKKIKKVLIANRGEIAVRIIKACKALSIESVITVSDADRDTLAAKMADRIHAPSLPEAIKKMVAALSDFAVGGIDATIPFLRILMQQDDVVAGTTNVRWVEEFISRSPPGMRDDRSAVREKIE